MAASALGNIPSRSIPTRYVTGSRRVRDLLLHQKNILHKMPNYRKMRGLRLCPGKEDQNWDRSVRRKPKKSYVICKIAIFLDFWSDLIHNRKNLGGINRSVR